MVVEILKEAVFWAHAIALSTPFIFGALGALLCARAGVIHLGIEGIFVAGAFAGAAVASHGGGAWDGVSAALAVGIAFGVLHAVLTGPLRAPQPLAGLAVTLLATGMSLVGARLLATVDAGSIPKALFATIAVAVPAEAPAAIATLLRQSPLTYLALLLAFVLAYVLGRTPLGLAIRACGDNPAALAAQGRSVHGLRAGAIVAGSAMMAVGGACLVFATGGTFAIDAVGGRGLVCLAIAMAVAWRPLAAAAIALPFGAMAALPPYLPPNAGGLAPSDVLLALMLAVAIVALAAASRRGRKPAALGAGPVGGQAAARAT